MRTLVVGYGSIGQRHAGILFDLGCEVAVLTNRECQFPKVFSKLETALVEWSPDYIVIANRTSEHIETLQVISGCGYRGRILVEKPLCAQAFGSGLTHQFSSAVVGYNLRCHPLLERLKEILESADCIVSAHIYAGSYLPSWRKSRDYRECYSAHGNQGGGVLRDLSHEIDSALWLFGSWRRLSALTGKFSRLEIDSEDTATILMSTDRCPSVSIHLNYLDRSPRRSMIVNTGDDTIVLDLVNHTISMDGKIEKLDFEVAETYRLQHQRVLTNRTQGLCSFEEGLDIVAAIDAAERSSLTGTRIQK
ncbi:MAG: Gfo/Idh/MocA family oxidoreductase [Verrucomicrobiae bacterium]